MIHTHFRNTDKYLKKYLFERYESIADESKPSLKNFIFSGKEETLCDCYEKDIIKSMMDPDRIEIDNPYSLHRKIPSARNLNSNIILVREISEKIIKYFQYDIRSCNLYKVFETENLSNEKNRRDILIVFNYNKIGAFYGRFGFILSCLDAGHQLNFLKETSKYPLIVEYFPYKNILLTIKLKKEEDITYCNKYSEEELKFISTLIDSDEILDGVFKDIIECGKKTELLIKEDKSYIKNIVKRRSLQSFQGIRFDKTNKNIEKDSMIRTSYKDVHIIAANIKERKTVSSDSKNLTYIQIDDVLHDTHEYINADNADSYFLAVPNECINDPAGIFRSFIQASAAMDLIGARCAQYFEVERCFRNINDKVILKSWKDYPIILYLMITGTNITDINYEGEL